MRNIGNILWYFPLSGLFFILGYIFWYVLFYGIFSALVCYFVGKILVLTTVAAPIGFGLIEFAKLQLLPYSYRMVTKDNLAIDKNTSWKAYSLIIKVIYFPFGVLMFLIGILQVIGLFVTIFGAPIAIVLAKSLTTYLHPMGKVCVPVEVANKITLRKSFKQYLDK